MEGEGVSRRSGKVKVVQNYAHGRLPQSFLKFSSKNLLNNFGMSPSRISNACQSRGRNSNVTERNGGHERTKSDGRNKEDLFLSFFLFF